MDSSSADIKNNFNIIIEQAKQSKMQAFTLATNTSNFVERDVRLIQKQAQSKEKTANLISLELEPSKHTNGMYKGYFENNKFDGLGVFTYINNAKYSGEWKNGARDGIGVLIFANGDRYEGEFSENKFNGIGVYTYFKGDKYRESKYSGEWKNGVMDGVGISSEDSDTYYGEWKNGVKDGIGAHVYHGSTYEGEWKNNLKNGTGSITDDTNTYTGQFKDNKRNGYGIFNILKDEIKGEWKDGVVVNFLEIQFTKNTDKDKNITFIKEDGEIYFINESGKKTEIPKKSNVDFYEKLSVAFNTSIVDPSKVILREDNVDIELKNLTDTLSKNFDCAYVAIQDSTPTGHISFAVKLNDKIYFFDNGSINSRCYKDFKAKIQDKCEIIILNNQKQKFTVVDKNGLFHVIRDYGVCFCKNHALSIMKQFTTINQEKGSDDEKLDKAMNLIKKYTNHSLAKPINVTGLLYTKSPQEKRHKAIINNIFKFENGDKLKQEDISLVEQILRLEKMLKMQKQHIEPYTAKELHKQLDKTMLLKDSFLYLQKQRLVDKIKNLFSQDQNKNMTAIIDSKKYNIISHFFREVVKIDFNYNEDEHKIIIDTKRLNLMKKAINNLDDNTIKNISMHIQRIKFHKEPPLQFVEGSSNVIEPIKKPVNTSANNDPRVVPNG